MASRASMTGGDPPDTGEVLVCLNGILALQAQLSCCRVVPLLDTETRTPSHNQLNMSSPIQEAVHSRGCTGLVSEPDPWKNRKEGLGDRLGWKLASFPGPRRGGEKGLVSTVCACA